MPDKDKIPNNDINKGGQNENLQEGYKPDVMKSFIPDFQYTPPTPQTPPPAEGNSGGDNQTSNTSDE
jgi:hypothetical protein